MTRIDKDQLEKISGGAGPSKLDHPTRPAEPGKNEAIDEEEGSSPGNINPVVRPGEADT